jgi:type III secretory pathway component EscS
MHPHKDDIIAGFVGFTLTAIGAITSMQEQLLWGVQFLSGVGAVLVAALTVCKMTRKKG